VNYGTKRAEGGEKKIKEKVLFPMTLKTGAQLSKTSLPSSLNAGKGKEKGGRNIVQIVMNSRGRGGQTSSNDNLVRRKCQGYWLLEKDRREQERKTATSWGRDKKKNT